MGRWGSVLAGAAAQVSPLEAELSSPFPLACTALPSFYRLSITCAASPGHGAKSRKEKHHVSL